MLAGPEGFGFLSKDNNFGMMIRWILQADVRGELGTLIDDAERDTFLVRFAGLALTARFYKRIRSELAATLGQVEVTPGGAIDEVSHAAGSRLTRMVGGGVNWYPNLGVRVMVDVQHTTFQALAGTTAIADETVVVGRFQVVL